MKHLQKRMQEEEIPQKREIPVKDGADARTESCVSREPRMSPGKTAEYVSHVIAERTGKHRSTGAAEKCRSSGAVVKRRSRE